jgi:hypothetical protein
VKTSVLHSTIDDDRTVSAERDKDPVKVLAAHEEGEQCKKKQISRGESLGKIVSAKHLAGYARRRFKSGG